MVQEVKRSSLTVKHSGRSADYIAPAFGTGCLLNCSYCYIKNHFPLGFEYASNIKQILDEISDHAYSDKILKPNNIDDLYTVYEISEYEDFASHLRFYPWEKIFDFFRLHPIAKATLAIKKIPYDILGFDPEKKVRLRITLMPQQVATIVEPNTPPIIDRIKSIDMFIDAGYEVEISFSPIISYGFDEWLIQYENLFKSIDQNVTYKDEVKSEALFLIHDEKRHIRNLHINPKAEDFLWKPQVQTRGDLITYNPMIKRVLRNRFIQKHTEIIPWNKLKSIH